MNATQQRYARERAKSILRVKKEALAKKFRDAEVRLTPKQRLAALKEGRVTFTKPSAVGSGHYIGDFVTFHGEVPKDTAGFAEAEKKLTAAYDRLIDGIVLGKEEEALAALARFEAAA